jgi:uncharacterized damage-inducible protein DinB
MTQCERLADQIRRAFEGEAWHGDSLLEILSGVDASSAAARPISNGHSIWELALHIRAWDHAVLQRADGNAVELSDAENFPVVSDASSAAWQGTLLALQQTHAELVKAIEAFPDSRLNDPVPGKSESYYDFYYLFSGIAQHELYHAGQIALLKKLVAKPSL